jgi:threonine dehydrogenase-like Zn-dependent dehydrogenase
MKALAVVPGTKGVRLIERPEPKVGAPDEVLLKVLRVGICGTDREEAGGGRALSPEGQKDLVIGHEMLGRVMNTGEAVTTVRKDDLAVFTVRRGCGQCLPCGMNRPDMCRSGKYKERGIWGLDGYQTEYVVDKEQYLVRVPPGIGRVGVLIEPLSVAEKAIDEALRIQSARMPDAADNPDWIRRRRCLVAGLGPIGLLAALALRIRGAEVYGLDIVGPETPRPVWIKSIGGRYIDARQVPPEKVAEQLGPMDLIFEAAGIPALAFNLLDALGLNGVCVLTGIPGGSRPVELPGAELIRALVLGNQVMLGSVNASRDHFQHAVDDMVRASEQWGPAIPQLITHRFTATGAADALLHHTADEIKAVIEWTET